MSYAFPDTDFDRSGSHAEALVEARSLELNLTVARNRVQITAEPELTGTCHDPRFPDNDWIGTVNMGGGAVPSDFEWRCADGN